ncbi:MAG: Uncharacterized protein CEN89_470 [Candidatus Berkelbacteria bacterium Licking1014_7]|uniref:LTD domain-containing protein n=1 Tax=Candidatus Berkelbacteria bacterium Licking1014_7 TaxID=2017147 RepID=A0A554LIW0_9BACT|nr:MAG: Uncharacterized protein CEN89_470 [Candidatus Berkelbacteria bacterium Licking1014_7]
MGKDEDGEFIEIYNNFTEEMDLTGWSLDDKIDAGSSPYFLSGKILAHEYQVFYYSETKIILNNDADEVNLINPQGEIISSVKYTNAPEGKSWGLLADKYQWLDNLTPGAKNTSPPKIVDFQASRNFIAYNKDAEIDFKVEAIAFDAQIEKIEISLPYPFPQKILVGEEWQYLENQINAPQEMQIEVLVTDSDDQVAIAKISLYFYEDFSSIVMNEIYPNPENGEEFIEIFNQSSLSKNLAYYQLDDGMGGSKPFIFSKEQTIPAWGYLVGYKSQTNIILNNDTDSARFIDPLGKVVAEINYTKTERGKSYNLFIDNFEKKWSWSALKTPGAKNEKIVYSQAIYISEILPNPIGKDEDGEFIEIYNSSNFIIDLSGWALDDEIGAGSNQYIFKDTIILPKSFLYILRSQNNIILNNDRDSVNLIDPDGKVVSSINYSATGKEGWSYSLILGNFFWTLEPTPGKENVLIQIEKKAIATVNPANSILNISQSEENTIIINDSSKIITEKIIVVKQSTNKILQITGDIVDYFIEPFLPKTAFASEQDKSILGAQTQKHFSNSRRFSIVRYVILSLFLIGIINLCKNLLFLIRLTRKE